MNFKIWIAVFCAEAAMLTVNAVLRVISRVKAKRNGIIKVKQPLSPIRFAIGIACAVVLAVLFVISLTAHRKYFDHIADMQARGIIAVAEYKNTTPEELLSGVSVIGEKSYEEIYVEHETARFQSLVEDARRSALVFGINALVLVLTEILAGCMGGGAYFTKNGIIFFAGLKLQKTSAKIENGKICFYLNGDTSRALTKLPADEKNTRLFSEFITPE